MENKKDKKADLSKRSIFFFQIGMILLLFLVWQLMEWKTYGIGLQEKAVVHMDPPEEELIPITVVQEPEPPQLPTEIPQEIEVAEDEDDVIEDVIAPSEPNNDGIIEVQDLKITDPEEKIEDFPFFLVEEVPVYPGCEGFDTNEERKECMSEKISAFVGRKFNSGLGEDLGLSGINRIYVQFKIEADGSITVMGARGPHPKLEEEAVRVARSLPGMQPGRQRGKAVGVTYSLPITLKID